MIHLFKGTRKQSFIWNWKLDCLSHFLDMTSDISFQLELMGDFNSENNLRDFYIPNYIFVPNSKAKDPSHIPACPVIVFINSKSGGQLGGELIATYRSLLNKNQVTYWISLIHMVPFVSVSCEVGSVGLEILSFFFLRSQFNFERPSLVS